MRVLQEQIVQCTPKANSRSLIRPGAQPCVLHIMQGRFQVVFGSPEVCDIAIDSLNLYDTTRSKDRPILVNVIVHFLCFLALFHHLCVELVPVRSAIWRLPF